MKRELFAVFKKGEFKEAAYVFVEGFSDDDDRYIKKCQKKYGLIGFSYSWGEKAKKLIPEGYEPRPFIPRPSNRKKKDAVINAMFKRKHTEDDGVNYDC